MEKTLFESRAAKIGRRTSWEGSADVGTLRDTLVDSDGRTTNKRKRRTAQSGTTEKRAKEKIKRIYGAQTQTERSARLPDYMMKGLTYTLCTGGPPVCSIHRREL